jgi:hypothetical protein
MKYIGLLLVFLLVSACSSPAEIEEIRTVEVRTIEVPRPAPIVPPVDQLRLRPVNWIIITPDNVEESFGRIQSGELVLFALTADGYENISLNLSDVRSMIEQQQRVIAIYQRQFRP